MSEYTLKSKRDGSANSYIIFKDGVYVGAVERVKDRYFNFQTSDWVVYLPGHPSNLARFQYFRDAKNLINQLS